MNLGKSETEQVTVHTEKKRKAVGGVVSIITKPEDKLYRIPSFKMRRLNENTSLPFGYKEGSFTISTSSLGQCLYY